MSVTLLGFSDPILESEAERYRSRHISAYVTQNIIANVTHLVGLLHTSCTTRNPTSKQHLPSVDNIAEIAELLTHEDAIILMQDEIACLDDMSLKGNIPDKV
jgi:hypothetical protein